MTLERDDAVSFGASVGIHALLLLITLFWVIASEPVPLRDIELTFISPETSAPLPEVRTEPAPTARPAVRERAAQRVTARPATSPQARRQPAAQRNAAPRPATPQTSRSAASAPRNATTAPSTTMPGTPRPAPRSAEPVDFTGQTTPKSGIPAQPRTGVATSAPERRDTKETAAPGTTGARDNPAAATLPSKPGPPATGALSDSPGASMQIAWEGEARTRVSGKLPAYPRDAQREAQVRVRFTVRPDGSVTELLLAQKGGPAFDEAALAAVRTWRFTPLAKDARRADQSATAVFTFRLK